MAASDNPPPQKPSGRGDERERGGRRHASYFGEERKRRRRMRGDYSYTWTCTPLRPSIAAMSQIIVLLLKLWWCRLTKLAPLNGQGGGGVTRGPQQLGCRHG